MYDERTVPDREPPFFFRRLWTGGTPFDEVTSMRRTPDGTLEITMGVPGYDFPADPSAVVLPPLASEGLVIYGRAVVPPVDREDVERMWKRGLVFSRCFSVVCPEGELGTHPIATLSEISREEFEAAEARGWS